MEEYTIKQIAELLGVSKPTVQKKIKELAVEPERKENNNRAFYSYADTIAVIRAIKPNYDFSLLPSLGAKPQNETAKPQNEAQNTAKPQNIAQNLENETAKPQNEELEFLKRALSIIEAQLAEKDKQLAVKDEQIKDLNNRLAEAYQITRGQQYIAAADKTTELLEADNRINEAAGPAEEGERAAAKAANIDEPQPQKKQSFWKRLFGK